MKYIRTKETDYGCIIDTIKYKEITGEDCFIPKNEIVDEADTIEELIDEFVDTSELKVSSTSTGGWLYDEFDSKNKCLIYYVEDERRTISLNEFDDLSKIYGAVWTEWGLKYVAKMNDKGELELL